MLGGLGSRLPRDSQKLLHDVQDAPAGLPLSKHLPGKLADHGVVALTGCRLGSGLRMRLRSLRSGADPRAHLILGIQIAALQSDASGS